MSCHTWKCAPTAIFSSVDISKVPGCHLIWQIFPRCLGAIWFDRWLLSEGCRVELKDWCFMNLQYTFLLWPFLTRLIMTVLSKLCKPDNFESHNSLKLLQLSEVWIIWTLLTFLLYVRQTWMTRLILTISQWGIIFL